MDVSMPATRRWAPLAIAAVLTTLLAAGLAAGVDRLVALRTGDPPRLATVPAATLVRLGLALAPARQAPYCELAGPAGRWDSIRPGWVACAVDEAAAATSARQGGPARILEAVLARVSATRLTIVGRDRLSWLVVLQRQPWPQLGARCQPQGGAWTSCGAIRWTGGGQLVLVDGYTGTVLSSLNLASPTPARSPRRVGTGA
jgi:hypothetical protein